MNPQSHWECLLLERVCLSYSRETVEAGLIRPGIWAWTALRGANYGNTQDGGSGSRLFGHLLPQAGGGKQLLEPLARVDRGRWAGEEAAMRGEGRGI